MKKIFETQIGFWNLNPSTVSLPVTIKLKVASREGRVKWVQLHNFSFQENFFGPEILLAIIFFVRRHL